MTDIEHDKRLIRIIFEQFKRLEKVKFKTEVGKHMGIGLSKAVKQSVKPYMIELAKRMPEE